MTTSLQPREAATDSAPKPCSPEAVLNRYRNIRRFTETLCDSLAVEDYVIQSMPDASPAKWHLAHTAWFFETFILKPYESRWPGVDPLYAYLFNSYYNAAGPRHCRPRRGTISRPTVAQVYEYRRQVDSAVERLLAGIAPSDWDHIRPLIEIGLNHEQQHQELLVTDIKHAFWCNPMRPTYRQASPNPRPADDAAPPAAQWVAFEEGVYSIGHDGQGFAYDNESPRHRVFLEDFALSSQLITNRQYLAFMDDGGYRRPELWLSAGWATVRQNDWAAPIYWEQKDEQWHQMTAGGLMPVAMDEPITHVSFFEADAFARWAGHRLPTEAEWEVAAAGQPLDGQFAETMRFHPDIPHDGDEPPRQDSPNNLRQMFGQLWQWTASPYVAYPGYQPPPGALGEYNGKFMCDQWVLRGGSCATPRSHIRRTYRNFFPANARWQFTGIRLAK